MFQMVPFPHGQPGIQERIHREMPPLSPLHQRRDIIGPADERQAQRHAMHARLHAFALAIFKQRHDEAIRFTLRNRRSKSVKTTGLISSVVQLAICSQCGQMSGTVRFT